MSQQVTSSSGCLFGPDKECNFVCDCWDCSDEKACGYRRESNSASVSFTCDFEVDTCGWRDVSLSAYRWIRDRGGISMYGTGPVADHTSGTTFGWYMAAETHRGKNPATASLRSPILRDAAATCEVRIHYHMWDGGLNEVAKGSLSVQVSDSTQIFDVWQSPKSSVNAWREIVFYTGRISGEFEITISSTQNFSARGDVAIDDVSFQHCAMPQPQRACPRGWFRCTDGSCVEPDQVCDGTTDCASGLDEANCSSSYMCPFTNDFCIWTPSGSPINWVRTNNRDHTSNTPEGYFIFAKSGNGKKGGLARLISPILKATTDSSCYLVFYYLMSGSDSITLSISYLKQISPDQIELGGHKGEMGNHWFRDRVVFNVSEDFQIVIVGNVAEGETAGIALDDLILSPGCIQLDGNSPSDTPPTQSASIYEKGVVRCDNGKTVTEHQACNFKDDCADGPNTKFCDKGAINSKSSSTDWVDHSVGRLKWVNESYMTLQGAGGHMLTAAEMRSPTQPPSGVACSMQLSYSLNGGHAGLISASVIDTALGTHHLSWYVQGERDTKWKSVRIPLGERLQPFQDVKAINPILEAVIGKENVNKSAAVFDIGKAITKQMKMEDFFFSGDAKGRCLGTVPALDQNQRCEARKTPECCRPPVESVGEDQSYRQPTAKFADGEHCSQSSREACPKPENIRDKKREDAQRRPVSELKSNSCIWIYSVIIITRHCLQLVYKTGIAMAQEMHLEFLTSPAFIFSPSQQVMIRGWVPPHIDINLNVGLANISFVDCKLDSTNVRTAEVSCNFETDMCGWYQDQRDDFEWALAKGEQGPVSNNKPQFDHTTGSGGFVYADASSGLQRGTRTRLHTSLQKKNQGTLCLSFWYHMYGPHIGTLNLMIRYDGQAESLLWTRTGTHGNAWHLGYQTLNPKEAKYQLIFESLSGGSSGAIALDDINLRSGSCIAQTDCSFEAGLCGYSIQGKNPWVRMKSISGTTKNGPSTDHTTETSMGHYMIVDTSKAAMASGKTATMSSEKHEPLSGDGCLGLWYHLSHSNAGTLNIYVEGQKKKQVLSISKNPGATWHYTSVSIQSETQWMVTLEAVAAGADLSFIAVDDIQLHRKSCPKPGTCDFELDSCGWSTMKHRQLRSLDWDWSSGAGQGGDHSPTADHTLGTKDGHYISIDTNQLNAGETSAWLMSEELPSTTGSCLKFWFRTDSEDELYPGELRVKTDSSAGQLTLWRIQGHRSTGWQQVNITVTSSVDFQLVFEAAKGVLGASGPVALDDIEYIAGGNCDTIKEEEKTKERTDNTAIIVFGVLLGIILLVVAVAAVLRWVRKRQQTQHSEEPARVEGLAGFDNLTFQQDTVSFSDDS
ncbi:apical endosomal glycoprotein [Ambystoma mexicanum]|uniref:apical endosomal glycoprotein n=1 Tax=Ambystoma mexicanum TaxID=8296 RepID=UPI0037E6FE06